MSKQQGMKEVLELETFTNQDPSTSYHIFQELGTPWPYFVLLQGENNILGPLFRDTQCLMDLREKHLLQSYTLRYVFLHEGRLHQNPVFFLVTFFGCSNNRSHTVTPCFGIIHLCR